MKAARKVDSTAVTTVANLVASLTALMADYSVAPKAAVWNDMSAERTAGETAESWEIQTVGLKAAKKAAEKTGCWMLGCTDGLDEGCTVGC